MLLHCYSPPLPPQMELLAHVSPASPSTAMFTSQPAVPMTSDSIRQLIHQAREAWATLDANGVAQLFTPQGELIVPGQRWQGRAAIQQAVEEFASQSTDIDIQIHRILVEGNQAMVEWSWTETDRATGQRSRADDAIAVEIQDGLIQRWREYIDSKTPQS